MELDALNGNFDARRVDIVMDVGSSLNPAIDIGQIEGGFMQGMGWSCMEELVWGDEGHPWVKRGHLQTKGPGASLTATRAVRVAQGSWIHQGFSC